MQPSANAITPSGQQASIAAYVPPRVDGMPVKPYSRGSTKRALEIASDPALLAAARAKLDQRLYSTKNAEVREGKLETWSSVAKAANYSQPFALTKDLVFDVVAVLMEAGFRSVNSYVGLARQRMELDGGTITRALEIQTDQALRAAVRGLGPPKRAHALPCERFPELPADREPWCKGGPCFPIRVNIISIWWLLREIEAGNLTLKCVRMIDAEAILDLPPTKTAQQGFTTPRALGCCCSAAPGICPRHTLEHQRAWVQAEFPHLGDDAPLFPTLAGTAPSKAAMVGTIQATAARLGLPLTGPTGVELFTGHVWRVSGAQFLARMGIDVWRIQILARWAGRTVAQYVADAPLHSSLALEAALGRDLSAVRQAIADARARLVQVADGQQTGAAQSAIDDALQDCTKKSENTAGVALPKPSVTDIVGARVKGWRREPLSREVFLRNKATKRLHAFCPPLALAGGQALHDLEAQIRSTVALSWCNDFSLHARAAELSERVAGPLCEKCFGRPRDVPSSSSSSSSASD